MIEIITNPSRVLRTMSPLLRKSKGGGTGSNLPHPGELSFVLVDDFGFDHVVRCSRRLAAGIARRRPRPGSRARAWGSGLAVHGFGQLMRRLLQVLGGSLNRLEPTLLH